VVRRARTAAAIAGLLDEMAADDPQRAVLEARASRYVGECGCKLGSVFLAVASIVVPVLIGFRGDVSVGVVVVGVLAVFASSVVGKVLGLLIALVRLMFLHASLSRRVGVARAGYVELH
jgi:hypothetical protein